MLFNAEIETIFSGFKVNNELIDLAYLFYGGHKDKYIVYSQVDTANSYSSDDDISGVIVYYDFDFYSKGNYSAIIKAVKDLLRSCGWTWQPNRDSEDLYDNDTGYYHKTVCFAKPLQFDNNEEEYVMETICQALKGWFISLGGDPSTLPANATISDYINALATVLKAPEVFTIHLENSSTVTESYEDIKSAYDSGKTLVVSYNGGVFAFANYDDENTSFSFCYTSNGESFSSGYIVIGDNDGSTYVDFHYN